MTSLKRPRRRRDSFLIKAGVSTERGVSVVALVPKQKLRERPQDPLRQPCLVEASTRAG
jgi:hypothetical protein